MPDMNSAWMPLPMAMKAKCDPIIDVKPPIDVGRKWSHVMGLESSAALPTISTGEIVSRVNRRPPRLVVGTVPNTPRFIIGIALPVWVIWPGSFRVTPSSQGCRRACNTWVRVLCQSFVPRCLTFDSFVPRCMSALPLIPRTHLVSALKVLHRHISTSAMNTLSYFWGAHPRSNPKGLQVGSNSSSAASDFVPNLLRRFPKQAVLLMQKQRGQLRQKLLLHDSNYTTVRTGAATWKSVVVA